MKQKEKEILDKINLALENIKDEINKYSDLKIKVGLKFGKDAQKIQTVKPPVTEVLTKYKGSLK